MGRFRREDEDMHLVSLAESVGWEVLSDWLRDKIKNLTSILRSTRFTEIADIARLQAEIDAYEKVIIKVENKNIREE